MLDLLVVILPGGVELLLVLGDPSAVVDLLVVILIFGLEFLLVFVDISAVVLLDVLDSHLSFRSGLVDPFGSVVNSGNELLWTLDDVVFDFDFMSNIRLPFALMSPVSFVVLECLLDDGVVSGSPCSVMIVEVWKVDAVLVRLPHESVVYPNESVEPGAGLSVLPNKASMVVPVVTKLGNWSVSGNHMVSENRSVNPMVAGNSNDSSGMNNSGRSINPLLSSPSFLSLDSVILHHSVSSPNLVVGGPVSQLSDSVSSPNLVCSLDSSGGGPSLMSSDLMVSPFLVRSSDSSGGVEGVLFLDSSGCEDGVRLSDGDVLLLDWSRSGLGNRSFERGYWSSI